MIGDILQPTHLIFILLVALLVLGPKRLPEVGRSLGKGIRDFRGALSGNDDEPSEPEPLSVPSTAPMTPATTTVDASVAMDAPTPPVLDTTPVPPTTDGEVEAPTAMVPAADSDGPVNVTAAPEQERPEPAAASVGQARPGTTD